MRKESTRDHVDLLLSCKHWPLVYAVDMACDVVDHVEVRLPQLANAMWGERRGCFQKPIVGVKPEVSCNTGILRHSLINVKMTTYSKSDRFNMSLNWTTKFNLDQASPIRL